MESWHKFVTLQVEMKNMAIRILAALLTIWYSMSIIGFDVHTCNGSGHSFVVSFLDGFSCGDIHPEHECEPHSCCANHCEDTPDHGVRIGPLSCCSDDYQVLELTGMVSGDEGRDLSAVLLLAGIPAAVPACSDSSPVSTYMEDCCLRPFCRHVRPHSFQPLYAVWRI